MKPMTAAIIIVALLAVAFISVLILFALSGITIFGGQILTPGEKAVYTGKDVFTYDILYADSPKNQPTGKGEVTAQQFTEAFDNFPSQEQAKLANKLSIQSPTLSAHDQLNNMTLFISPVTNAEGSSLGFVSGITKSVPLGLHDDIYMKETSDKEQVHVLIKKFFNRDPGVIDFLMNIKN